MNYELDKFEHDASGNRFDDVAVIIPCLDEALSIADVVMGFTHHLPGAQIHVCDNGSSDNTAAVARQAGAIVCTENNKGKGHALRRLFRDTEAEIYIMVDGDMTYDISTVVDLIEKVRRDGIDLMVGTRVTEDGAAYRRGHRFGNKLLSNTVAWLFQKKLGDMLSGYRIMSRRFVKSFPISAQGFEIETEMTIHAFQVEAAYAEAPVTYFARADGSTSKLSTYKDGFFILRTIADLLVLERPVMVFGGIGLAMILASVFWFLPVLAEYYRTGLVMRFPTLVVCATIGLTGLISIFSGIILAGVARSRRDQKRLSFLSFKRVPQTAAQMTSLETLRGNI
ncbi:MAG: glycosyltransferase family 2 protein, partial [Pseudomonadota bacterium]|nr:glycosyltransferase family 2 protein [Pseudomonadota bacterium]